MGVSVLEIDLSTNLIDIAKRNAPLAQFKSMDFEAIEIPSAIFDGAWPLTL